MSACVGIPFALSDSRLTCVPRNCQNLSKLADQMKRCAECLIEKPEEEFLPWKSPRSHDGLSPWCKACFTPKTVYSSKENSSQQLRLNAPEGYSYCSSCKRELPLEKFYFQTGARTSTRCQLCSRCYAYGITALDYEELLEFQQGVCGICRKESQALEIDHDHSTGQVRGLLCRNCNLGLGMFKDDIERLGLAIVYLSL